MRAKRKTRAVHDEAKRFVRIYGRKNPGLCVQCGQMANHLYPKPDGSGLYICYPCKRESK